ELLGRAAELALGLVEPRRLGLGPSRLLERVARTAQALGLAGLPALDHAAVLALRLEQRLEILLDLLELERARLATRPLAALEERALRGLEGRQALLERALLLAAGLVAQLRARVLELGLLVGERRELLLQLLQVLDALLEPLEVLAVEQDRDQVFEVLD